MSSKENWLTVGKIVAPQGLHGKLRVNPYSDFPERFTQPGQRWIQDSHEEPKEISLIEGKQIPGKSLYVISIQGINNRTAAESLVGKKLLVHAKNRPHLEANEFHFLDLVELEVRLNEQGPSIGKVKDLTRAGNDLLEIETLEGKKILIPFVNEIVPKLNLKEGWIQLTPPPGLLDLENLD